MLLAGVLIIDATDRLGWLAGRLLADLGADVIKIERKGSERTSSQWRAVNVNKRVVEHDATQAADRDHLDTLLEKADICLLTPGASEAVADLDPDALRAAYPRLVVVAIRPFVRLGPRSRAPWRSRASPTASRCASASRNPTPGPARRPHAAQ
jgi:crotonobetainyl-CoA:carnitine CoA-transferase CaiB-like acyl-CoA transferase